jgi:hypothetical protein
MLSPATNRERLLEIARGTLAALEKRPSFAATPAEEVIGAPDERARIAAELRAAVGTEQAADITEGVAFSAGADIDEGRADIPFIADSQPLALLQSAYDEYLEERPAEITEAPFDTSDPGWLSVAWEKLKALVKGKRKFIRHTNLASFRYDLPENAVVALFADWGTGEPTAQRVMKQIRAAHPTHAIHMGDVYHSGTPKEVQNRFLKIIEDCGPPWSSCRYFALNSNHEMYSGGYGYFDTTLPKFGQEASYFNLGNDHFRLIGLDSGYEDHGLKDPQGEWLDAQLNGSGKKILLTHHQLFSPYERRAADRKLEKKTARFLNRIYAWFWGHEHKLIVFQDHRGIKARCIGNGAIPGRVPYGNHKVDGIPVEFVDERPAPGTEREGIHGFALLNFSGAALSVKYVDEFGTVVFSEEL